MDDRIEYIASTFSEDLKRWFISQEVDMFRYRFMQESAQSIEDFLKISGLNYEPVRIMYKLLYNVWLSYCSLEKGFQYILYCVCFVDSR